MFSTLEVLVSYKTSACITCLCFYCSNVSKYQHNTEFQVKMHRVSIKITPKFSETLYVQHSKEMFSY